MKTVLHVEKGLNWVRQLGAYRTLGFGRLVRVKLSEPVIISLPSASVGAPATVDAKRLHVSLRPLSPFCLCTSHPNKNLFESLEFIPGGVVKGAIASMWAMLLGNKPYEPIEAGSDPNRKELCDCFDKIRFTHFLTGGDCLKRSVTPPLSLVKFGKDGFRDVALCDRAEDMVVDDCAPAFDIDWKDRSDVDALFGRPKLKRELRVRTAIDSDKRRSEKEKLFAYEMVVPNGASWHGYIDLPDDIAGETARTEAHLRSLLHNGIFGMGKTGAPVRGFIPRGRKN